MLKLGHCMFSHVLFCEFEAMSFSRVDDPELFLKFHKQYFPYIRFWYHNFRSFNLVFSTWKEDNRAFIMETPKSNHQRRGSIPPFSMSQTLWSNEKSCRDSRSNDEKGVNVKVLLRCRYELKLAIAYSTCSYNYMLQSQSSRGHLYESSLSICRFI